ncbi:hypothetical protein [Sphingobacterium zeae]|uniref:DUF4393 domain-containing protein n=1 Tax=Sphingobacterium zeae TaxID=1776859 RepID=A0ABU0U6D4_9SPHI|nr:hypothetical protein [Sphingobacterium zeae]MDQ1150490.1 hypothetical protein [Sphingobacterium zeae]
MKDINKTTGKDVGYAAIKALVGLVPVLGGAASELFGLIVTPPLEKRRQQWMEEIAGKLAELEQQGRIDFSKLSDNEEFIDVVLQATSLAIKTSETEKLIALKNAVINTGINEGPGKTKSHIFLDLVNEFTIWHLKILTLYDDPKGWFDANGKTFPKPMMGGLSSVLKEAYPEIASEGELVKLIWKKLYDAGFHNSAELSTMMSGDGMLSSRTTRLGKEFLEFIREHS